MRNIVIRLQALCCLLCCHSVVFSQELNWNINTTKPVTFRSQNPIDDPGFTEDKMWHVSVKELLHFDWANQLHGILLKTFDSKSKVVLSVYLYDPLAHEPDEPKVLIATGPLLYQCSASDGDEKIYVHDAEHYELGDWLAWWPNQPEEKSPFNWMDQWSSTRPSIPLFSAFGSNYQELFTDDDGFVSTGPQAHGDKQIAVVIEVQIFKAEVYSINVPGIGEITPAYFNPPFLNIQTKNEIIVEGKPNKFQYDLEADNPQDRNDQVDFSDIRLEVRYLDQPGKNYSHWTLKKEDILRAENGRFKQTYKDANWDAEPPGPFSVYAEYDIKVTNRNGKVFDFPGRKQFLFTVRKFAPEDQDVFNIQKLDYNGLPVYKLSGGMSAEYAVEKSVADLASGVSETWDVRKVDGKPDLKDGGPVSVYPKSPEYDFLTKSINETVTTYNNAIGKNAEVETVIIGMGVANAPYLSSDMKAPFLPLQFLVSVHSVKEVGYILDAAKMAGHRAYATLGYDPSMTDVGVAWIKLLSLPEEYRDFIQGHGVKHVIFLGYADETLGGEVHARRINIAGQADEKFAEGSMYMMSHGSLTTYKEHYRDYYNVTFGPDIIVPDWEGGIANVQLANFSNDIRNIGPHSPSISAIQTSNSADFYRWALETQMFLLQKMNEQPATVSVNEYLIGYPGFELFKKQVPFLYWQGIQPNKTAFSVFNFGGFKSKMYFPNLEYTNLLFFIQAKADRTPLLNELKEYFPNVKMNTWQKADVWDPLDGYDSPCEAVAKAIVGGPGGVAAYKSWNDKRETITSLDLNKLVKASVKPPPLPYTQFPNGKTTPVLDLKANGIYVDRTDYEPNDYWAPLNYPNNVSYSDMTQNGPKLNGYLNTQEPPFDRRKQQITIAHFDMANQSDEFDLRIHYKFNITDEDGLKTYDPALGEKQKMNCFEFTSIPFNHWFDIPSRVMAKEGAIMCFNGGVYDFDYNGIPGVVPFIKQNGEIQAMPQILSYKGEGLFMWNWGKVKSAEIKARPLFNNNDNLKLAFTDGFKNSTNSFSNVMGGMTVMTGKQPYDIMALQPGWMKDYPAFPPYYLVDNQRCYFAPLSLGCLGTEVTAPIDEGWNDCSLLPNDQDIKRFSALAYRQYPKIFDAVANARTFVGIKKGQLDIGIIAGDYGEKEGLRGPYATKQWGMHNYEVSQFYQHQGYDALVNLDGGSSTQFWINGYGPQQLLDGYPLTKDNQGPYFSRLLSSFIMVVPKLHLDQVPVSYPVTPFPLTELDNTASQNFPPVDEKDVKIKKNFIDLTPSMDKLNIGSDGSWGSIAGEFSIKKNPLAQPSQGAVLFYLGEDAYYPDTKGVDVVHPRLRNMLVVGVGGLPMSLIDSLNDIEPGDVPDEYFLKFRAAISLRHSFYYIKVRDGKLIEYYFRTPVKKDYMDGTRYVFQIYRIPDEVDDKVQVYVSDHSAHTEVLYKATDGKHSLFDFGVTTHCYIGAANLDGRFLTGNSDLKVGDFMFIVGKDAVNKFSKVEVKHDIGYNMFHYGNFGNWGDRLYIPGVYALPFVEHAGYHVFALSRDHTARFYGLRPSPATPVSEEPVKHKSKSQ